MWIKLLKSLSSYFLTNGGPLAAAVLHALRNRLGMSDANCAAMAAVDPVDATLGELEQRLDALDHLCSGRPQMPLTDAVNDVQTSAQRALSSRPSITELTKLLGQKGFWEFLDSADNGETPWSEKFEVVRVVGPEAVTLLEQLEDLAGADCLDVPNLDKRLATDLGVLEEKSGAVFEEFDATTYRGAKMLNKWVAFVQQQNARTALAEACRPTNEAPTTLEH